MWQPWLSFFWIQTNILSCMKGNNWLWLHAASLVMVHHSNCLDQPVFMAIPKLMLTESSIHYRFESCVLFWYETDNIQDIKWAYLLMIRPLACSPKEKTEPLVSSLQLLGKIITCQSTRSDWSTTFSRQRRSTRGKMFICGLFMCHKGIIWSFIGC